MLLLSFQFRPKDGSATRDIRVAVATQNDDRYPFMITIDWADGRNPDQMRWPGPPLSGLELAARFVAQRILDRVELWGGGTLHPDVEKPAPFPEAEAARPMQALDVTFTPTSGDPPRLITLRIGTPEKGAHSWSARVEILGFDEPHVWTCQGEDWAQVLELAAKVLPVALECKMDDAGGGTLDPPFYERDPAVGGS